MRRVGVMAAAVVGLLGVSVMIVVGGRAMQPAAAISSVQSPETETSAEPPASQSNADVAGAVPAEPATSMPSRLVAPAEIAPPVVPGRLQRIAPRKALSQLSLALPPKPKLPDDWDGTILYRPVATGAGSLEAKGYTIVIAGVDPVALDETCGAGGDAWNCGVRARAAFRAMLRGRAVTCKIPGQADRTAIAAPCRIGKQDIGTWLVANGWARASAKGPYADVGRKAEAGRKGVFGPGPDAAASMPALMGTLPVSVTPPADPPTPFQ